MSNEMEQAMDITVVMRQIEKLSKEMEALKKVEEYLREVSAIERQMLSVAMDALIKILSLDVNSRWLSKTISIEALEKIRSFKLPQLEAGV